MWSNPNGIGKVGHELSPVCRLLLPAVAYEERRSGPDTQYRQSGLGTLGNKPHRQHVLQVSHFDFSGEVIVGLDVAHA